MNRTRNLLAYFVGADVSSFSEHCAPRVEQAIPFADTVTQELNRGWHARVLNCQGHYRNRSG